MKWYKKLSRLKFNYTPFIIKTKKRDKKLINEVKIIKNCNIEQGYVLFNCQIRGIKIGYLNLTRYDREKIKLADIFVYENYRNMGVGSKLLEEAIKLSISLEIKLIYGVMCGETKKLERFYRKFGFEISDKNIELKLKKN